jgi:hypothetical protein
VPTYYVRVTSTEQGTVKVRAKDRQEAFYKVLNGDVEVVENSAPPEAVTSYCPIGLDERWHGPGCNLPTSGTPLEDEEE